MVIYDLDVVSVALAKFETNTPAIVDRHRPLPPPIALELMEADALQRTEIAERLGKFRASRRSTAVSKSNPRNWFGRSPSQTFRAAEFRQDLIMARTYYEIR
jgi:hypothetical protein